MQDISIIDCTHRLLDFDTTLPGQHDELNSSNTVIRFLVDSRKHAMQQSWLYQTSARSQSLDLLKHASVQSIGTWFICIFGEPAQLWSVSGRPRHPECKRQELNRNSAHTPNIHCMIVHNRHCKCARGPCNTGSPMKATRLSPSNRHIPSHD